MSKDEKYIQLNDANVFKVYEKYCDRIFEVKNKNILPGHLKTFSEEVEIEVVEKHSDSFTESIKLSMTKIWEQLVEELKKTEYHMGIWTPMYLEILQQLKGFDRCRISIVVVFCSPEDRQKLEYFALEKILLTSIEGR